MENITSLETIQDFINFFSEIPEEKWRTGEFIDSKGCCCVYGHLGCRWPESNGWTFTPLAKKLMDLIDNKFCLMLVNDDKNNRFRQETPKQRILAALETLK